MRPQEQSYDDAIETSPATECFDEFDSKWNANLFISVAVGVTHSLSRLNGNFVGNIVEISLANEAARRGWDFPTCLRWWSR